MRVVSNEVNSDTTEYGTAEARDILGVSLDELGELYCGQSPASTALNFGGRGWPYITGPEAWNGKEIHVAKWVEDPPRTVPDGCVFITVKGAGVGKLFQGLACAIGRDIYAFKPNSSIEYGYLMWALRSVIEEIKMKASGDIPGLTKGDLLEHDIPLFPLPEQRRIVAKLDALQSRTRIAREALDAVAPLLKSFRQSVLQAAVTGALTEDWRSKHGESEPWKEAKIGSVVDRVEAGKSLSCIETPPEGDQCGIIKISAVTWGKFDELESKTLPDPSQFIESRRVKAGDFLISRANTLELVGCPVIVGSVHRNLMLSDKVLRLVMPESQKEWLSIFLRSSDGRTQIEARSTGNQLSMRNIGQSALLDIDLPLPPLAEQTEIVKRAQHLFAMADAMEAEFAAAQRALDQLDQSVLATAFRGELVPQDPTDEPASVLLERIRAARAALPDAKPKRGRKPGVPPLQAAKPTTPKKRGRPRKG